MNCAHFLYTLFLILIVEFGTGSILYEVAELDFANQTYEWSYRELFPFRYFDNAQEIAQNVDNSKEDLKIHEVGFPVGFIPPSFLSTKTGLWMMVHAPYTLYPEENTIYRKACRIEEIEITFFIRGNASIQFRAKESDNNVHSFHNQDQMTDWELLTINSTSAQGFTGRFQFTLLVYDSFSFILLDKIVFKRTQTSSQTTMTTITTPTTNPYSWEPITVFVLDNIDSYDVAYNWTFSKTMFTYFNDSSEIPLNISYDKFPPDTVGFPPGYQPKDFIDEARGLWMTVFSNRETTADQTQHEIEFVTNIATHRANLIEIRCYVFGDLILDYFRGNEEYVSSSTLSYGSYSWNDITLTEDDPPQNIKLRIRTIGMSYPAFVIVDRVVLKQYSRPPSCWHPIRNSFSSVPTTTPTIVTYPDGWWPFPYFGKTCHFTEWTNSDLLQEIVLLDFDDSNACSDFYRWDFTGTEFQYFDNACSIVTQYSCDPNMAAFPVGYFPEDFIGVPTGIWMMVQEDYNLAGQTTAEIQFRAFQNVERANIIEITCYLYGNATLQFFLEDENDASYIISGKEYPKSDWDVLRIEQETIIDRFTIRFETFIVNGQPSFVILERVLLKYCASIPCRNPAEETTIEYTRETSTEDSEYTTPAQSSTSLSIDVTTSTTTSDVTKEVTIEGTFVSTNQDEMTSQGTVYTVTTEKQQESSSDIKSTTEQTNGSDNLLSLLRFIYLQMKIIGVLFMLYKYL